MKLSEVPLKKRKAAGICSHEGCRIKEGLAAFQHTVGPILLCRAHVLNLDAGEEAHAIPYTPPAPSAAPAPEQSTPVVAGEIVPAVAQDARAEVAATTAEANSMLAAARALPVETNEDLAFVADVIADVKGKWKRLEELKRTVTQPLNEALAAARALFNPGQKLLTEIEAVLKAKVGAYHASAEARRLEALATVDSSATTAEVTEALVELEAAQLPTIPGLSVRESWAYEVVDFKLVPELYTKRVLDETIVAAQIEMGVREIPGLRIFKKQVVASRSS